MNTLAFNNVLAQMFIRLRKFSGALCHQLLETPAVLPQLGFYLFTFGDVNQNALKK